MMMSFFFMVFSVQPDLNKKTAILIATRMIRQEGPFYLEKLVALTEQS